MALGGRVVTHRSLQEPPRAAATHSVACCPGPMQVYDKCKISAIKHRSVRREARIMRYLTDKR